MEADRIEDFDLTEFENILNDKDLNGKITLVAGGTMIVNNNLVIRCIRNYYELDKAFLKKLPAARQYACKTIQTKLGMSSMDVFACRRCHLNCLKLFQSGQLKRL